MKVLFVAGFGPIVRDMPASLRFYRETLGLPIVEAEDTATNKVDGSSTSASGRSPTRLNRASASPSGRRM